MDIQQITNDIHNQKSERTSHWLNKAEIKPIELPIELNKKSGSIIVRKIKSFSRRTPVLRTLYKTAEKFKSILTLSRQHNELKREFWTLNHQFILSKRLLDDIQIQQKILVEKNRVLQQNIQTLSNSNANENVELQSNQTKAPVQSPAHVSFDQLYHAFEQRFRGSQADVAQKQSQYMKRILSLPEALKMKPICDIGCGRGEWLDLLKEQKLEGIGVEPNESIARAAAAKGLQIKSCDALEFFDKV